MSLSMMDYVVYHLHFLRHSIAKRIAAGEKKLHVIAEALNLDSIP